MIGYLGLAALEVELGEAKSVMIKYWFYNINPDHNDDYHTLPTSGLLNALILDWYKKLYIQ